MPFGPGRRLRLRAAVLRGAPLVPARPGHGPVVEFGRHTSLRTRRLVHGSSSLPRPTSYAPVARAPSGRGRRGSLKTSVKLQVRLLPGVPRTRPDGDGGSLQNCDSRFNSPRVCHVGDAEVVEAAVRKTALTGFAPRGRPRLSLHRRARSDGNAFWSRKPALREGPG